MPIFVYRCIKCDNEVEVFIRTPKDKPPTKCEKCGGKMIKQITKANFKPPKWY